MSSTFFFLTYSQLEESEFSSYVRLVMVSNGTSNPPSVSVIFDCSMHLGCAEVTSWINFCSLE